VKKHWPGELVMGRGWSIYDGPIGDGDSHRHSAIQICIATDSKISLDIDNARIRASTIVVIGSNVVHKLQSSTGCATLLYLESSSVLGLRIRRAMGEESFRVPNSESQLRIQWNARHNERPSSSAFVRRIITELFPALDLTSGLDPIDQRVRQTLSGIDSSTETTPPSLHGFADQLGLSASRLRHIFTEQVGMSFSNYLLWSKLQNAVRSLDQGGTLTSAAYAGGFSDAAHMSRTFRRMFGISPSDLTARGVIRLDTSTDGLFDHSTP